MNAHDHSLGTYMVLPTTGEPNVQLGSDTFNKEIITNITSKIKEIAKLINNAKKHVRGSNTAGFLKQAYERMNILLKYVNIDPEYLYNRTTYTPASVCPESFMGTVYGFPYYYKGFERNNCGYDVPIWKLVTIIRYMDPQTNGINYSTNEIHKFLLSVRKTNNDFNVILSVDMSKFSSKLRSMYPTVTIIDSRVYSEGTALNRMIEEVNTPYVLIAKDVEFLTNDMRLERLVREIESLNVSVAGGATRDPNGHWKKGCFQSVYRNYTLNYLEGYDESVHECLFCDYVQGPFVGRKKYLVEHKFHGLNKTEGLFEEWFLGISQRGDETVICPDSMFHIHLQSKHNINWNKFMKKWNVLKSITPSGNKTTRVCSSHGRSFRNSKVVSPCDLQSNADAVKTVMSECENAGIICELQEGTALGAVKLGKTLPWERDADITFLTANHSAFQNLKDVFHKKGFSFTVLDTPWCCVDNITAGGKFLLRYLEWSIELYGQHKMDSKLMAETGTQPTKVLLDGQWVNVPRNPGLFVRNRYGREIYQHAQHWMTIGQTSGWINYTTNVFMSCEKPYDHDCLDRYNADGDLPFFEMLP